MSCAIDDSFWVDLEECEKDFVFMAYYFGCSNLEAMYLARVIPYATLSSGEVEKYFAHLVKCHRMASR